MIVAQSPKIVVGYDETPESETAVRKALAIAQRCLGSEVHVIFARDGDTPSALLAFGPSVPEGQAQLLQTELAEQKSRWLDRLLPWLREADLSPDRIRLHGCRDVPGHELLRIAAEQKADLIVVGTRLYRGFPRSTHGSIADSVIRLSQSAVLVLREEEAETALSSRSGSSDTRRVGTSQRTPVRQQRRA